MVIGGKSLGGEGLENVLFSKLVFARAFLLYEN